MIDIFYKEIINEASVGKISIDDEFYNIIFNTKISEDNINIKSNYKNNNVFIPTLIINNKKIFNTLLCEYVNLCKNYYTVYNEKKIMALLWSNATLNDYLNPVKYLENRINFIKNSNKMAFSNYYIEELKSNVIINNQKSSIYSETPSCLNITLNNGVETYELPIIYYGISSDIVYIYAIQNKKDCNKETNKYQKDIKRKMYSIDEGIDTRNDNYDNYGVGNLKDITSSFLFSATIATIIFKNNGINKIVIPSFLISRWNSKEIAFDNKEKYFKNNNIKEKIDRLKHDLIQENITEKLLRVFRRIDYHIDGVNITKYPEDSSGSLVLNIDKELVCNNNKIINDLCKTIQNENIEIKSK